MSNWYFSCYSLSPLSLIQSILFMRWAVDSSKVSLILLFCRLNECRSLSLLLSVMRTSLMTILLACTRLAPECPCHLMPESPKHGSELWSRWCWREVRDYLPQAAGYSPSNATHNTVGLLCHKGTLLAHGQPQVHQDPQGLSWKAVF